MSAKSASLAKSLHTVSVLVAVSRYVAAIRSTVPADEVPTAAALLGYLDAYDPHGLCNRAVAQLSKGAQS
jgi:hypothetical protein